MAKGQTDDSERSSLSAFSRSLEKCIVFLQYIITSTQCIGP